MSIYKKLKTSKSTIPLVESIFKITGNTPKVLVTETTVPDHLQHIPDTWDHHSKVDDATHEKISNAIPHGTHVSFPLAHGTANPDPDVVEHLSSHGWDVKDYKKGTATKKTMVGNPEAGIPMREKHVEKSIGSILNDTNAHDDVKKAFTNDPERSAARSFSKSSGGHHVVISTSPMAIAGMSTGTGWTSCMNLEGGAYNHHLRDDSEHGTHVAFLTHHDDKEGIEHGTPSRPIARIALKAFHHTDDEGNRDTIYRPESNSYGSAGSNFHKAVHEWAVKNYPGKEGATYEKNSDLYDDDGISEHRVMGKKDIDHAIDTNTSIIKSGSESVPHGLIDHAINRASEMVNDSKSTDPDKAVMAADRVRKTITHISSIPNLAASHVMKLHGMIRRVMSGAEADSHITGLATRHGEKFSTSMLNDHIQAVGGVKNVGNRTLMNPKLSEEHVDQLRTDQFSHIQPQKVKDKHIDRMVDEYVNKASGSYYNIKDFSNRLNAGHLDKLTKVDSTSLIPMIVNHPALNQQHHDNLVERERGHISVGTIMRQSKFARFSDTEKFGNGQWSAVKALADNPHMHEDDGTKVKDMHMKMATLEPHGHTVFAANVSNHMTKQDFTKLAESGKSVTFLDAHASHKHLDAIHEHIKAADSALSDHIEKEGHEFKDYPHTEDDKSEELQDKLHSHIENFAKNIDNHIDAHVEDGENETIKHSGEFDKALNHLDKLNAVDHYMTPHNSGRFDDRDHYDDHVGEVQNRLDTLHKNTESADWNRDW